MHTRKRRRAERSGSPLKQLHENAHEGSSAVPDSPVTSEDDEPLFDDPDIQETPDQECTDGGKADFSHVTDLTMEQIEHLENENRHLLSEVGEVRNKLNKQILTEECLRENEDMLQFYTGSSNFSLLMALLEVLKEGMAHTNRDSLTFQEMLIFLIRLRLNVPLQDLAYRFNVSQSTVCRVVNKWIDVAFVRLSRAVKWPEPEELQRTMPMVFRQCFGTRLAVILDCFELFIERPSSFLPRSHTWSNYKHHNTVKYLIGIAPQGVITFISRGWGGRSSDKVITEKCGVLNNLQPGDYVLADRGFTIGDSVGLHCAKLAIPAFTKGKPQLSACEVEKTRKLANVRIHVERGIGLLRNKYRILKYTLPVEMLTSEENGPTVLDKIVFVC
ncbi:uncharacterized protein LOC142584582 isoform X2 [Dermacentor variabilis]|uniref:uncharacterized protein LOC142584582 isoform X2 n=1 Tax=Dermacentor variabilis TaxID=34621 RepID=UPI003F5C58CF